MLEARKKSPTARAEKKTQIGIGVRAAVTRAHRDTDASPVPSAVDDAPTAEHVVADDAPTRVDGRAAPELPEDTDETLAPPPAPSASAGEDTSPRIAAPPPGARRRARSVHPRSAPGRAPADPRAGDDDDDDVLPHGPATTVMSAVELDDAIPERRDVVVPAHLDRAARRLRPERRRLGPARHDDPAAAARRDARHRRGCEDEDRGAIPMSNLDTAPLIVAPPSPPEPARGSPGDSERRRAPASCARSRTRPSRAIELIHTLEHANDRDEVVALMIAHLAETHQRAGFFVRPGRCRKAASSPCSRSSRGPPTMPIATLRLDRPSTLQDVVGTRLPYRGPMHDDASRTFLARVLGACPPEILLVPVDGARARRRRAVRRAPHAPHVRRSARARRARRGHGARADPEGEARVAGYRPGRLSPEERRVLAGAALGELLELGPQRRVRAGDLVEVARREQQQLGLGGGDDVRRRRRAREQRGLADVIAGADRAQLDGVAGGGAPRGPRAGRSRPARAGGPARPGGSRWCPPAPSGARTGRAPRRDARPAAARRTRTRAPPAPRAPRAPAAGGRAPRAREPHGREPRRRRRPAARAAAAAPGGCRAAGRAGRSAPRRRRRTR